LLLASFFSSKPILRKTGLLGSAVLMSLFTIYVFYMIKFSPGLPCTCGGIIQYMNWHQHLYFNTGLTLMSIFGIWLNNRQTKSPSITQYTPNITA
jgi:hypothetical protein